ncbi:PQQ-like beta-propeller repeat protein [Candidatus Pelagibacter ubique]|uniref:PQQ-binding-like beta-propeller repeat protein n=1 Tax=Pelagibacter ubique TaxID=198252 RepID=UPI0003C801D5
MNRLIVLIISIFFLTQCSVSEKLNPWKGGEKKTEKVKKIKKILTNDKKIINEFNKNLKLDLKNIKTNNNIVDNRNNFGIQDYEGLINKIGNYKFAKLENINQLNFKPIFLKDGLVFFDKKGTIIRYTDNQKILWKKNFYSKAEKKLKPKLNFIIDGKNLVIADNIAKLYSLNIDSGELNWSQNSSYPFNSEIKKINNKFFVVDYKNTLKCYNLSDGKECWELKTEDSFTMANSKFSLIIIKNDVIFSNSIGDITAVDINSGLIKWQLPTQSSNILNETYNFKISKLVSDENSIYFSNNKNQFYSIDYKTGTINWINEINSNLTPIINDNFIFTVSDEGYLYVLDKIKGNIIRINYLFENYKLKIRKKIKPIGFSIGNTNLYLTNNDGKMIIVDLNSGKVIDIQKISGNLVSKPFIHNQNLFVIKNGSIAQYN